LDKSCPPRSGVAKSRTMEHAIEVQNIFIFISLHSYELSPKKSVSRWRGNCSAKFYGIATRRGGWVQVVTSGLRLEVFARQR